MMDRRLILMRHAKSAWDTDAASDHARPLNKRGRRDAPRIGRRLVELDWAPEMVLSSDATRTRQTWELMSDGFERVRTCFMPSLYGADVGPVLDALCEVSAAIRTVMVLGHNPGWEEALTFFSGQQETLTTANAALLVVRANGWPQAASMEGGWTLESILRPKEL